MTSELIQKLLVSYSGFILLLTLHELGHAWMALRCGDDTAKKLGRVSLNPIVHMDLVGTVILPLLMLYLSYSGSSFRGMLVGWAKPVPVDPTKLRRPGWDDIAIAMAGPVVNLVLAVLLLGLARIFLILHLPQAAPYCKEFALISLILCFFNLIPIPPLDGSHVLRVVTGMSRELYARLVGVGFIVVILVMQIPAMQQGLHSVTRGTYKVMASWFGLF
jgi:Zn-dependent protease